MQSNTFRLRALCIVLSACGTATATAAPHQLVRSPRFAHHHPGSGSIWLSTFVYGEATYGNVAVYDMAGQHQSPTGYLNNPNCPDQNNGNCTLPVGLAADANGNLYGAFTTNNAPAPIAIYAPGQQTAGSLLNDAWSAPRNLAFGADGSLYAQSAVNVYRYPPNSQTPAANFFDSKAFNLNGVAVDRNGNVYVSYENRSLTNTIAIFSGGKNVPIETKISLGAYFPYSAPFAPDIALDSAGNILAVTTAGSSPGITAYSATAPYASLGAIGVAGSPVAYAFDATGTELFVADGGTGSVTEYGYDDTTNPQQPHVTGVINTLNTSYPEATGLAVYPALIAPI